MIPDDQVRAITSIIISIPLSYPLLKMNGQTKILYSIGCSLILQAYVYGWQLLLSLGLHVLIYIVILAKGRQCGLLVTLLGLILLSAYHIFRMISNYGSWEIDVSNILMGAICKYSLLAYAYQDGAFLDNQLRNQDQKNQKLKDLPKFLDYLSYKIFLPCCVVNNPITYFKYQAYMSQQNQQCRFHLKNCLTKMCKQTIIIIISAVLYFIELNYFPTEAMSNNSFYRNGFWYVLGYSYLSTQLLQFRYFLGFKLSMLPIHMSGLSYNYKLKDPFDNIKCIDIGTFLTSLSIPARINSWNILVQEWLRKCIYERLSTSKAKARLITFACSAFWHGFYGGYYISFFLIFLQIQLATLVYKLSKDRKSILVTIYNKYRSISRFFIWAIITFSFSQSAGYFVTLSLPKCWLILKSLYFLPPFLIILMMIVCQYILMQKKSLVIKNS